ncbi:hypothetical protein BC940DRAFT_301249 [Gongronella butleri]|nr:hypothetical protein BC940DRAFT_301249 [Gongronella butleri]
MEEMHSRDKDEEDQKAMRHILRRFEAEGDDAAAAAAAVTGLDDSAEMDDDDALASKLAGVDLADTDPDTLWQMLSASQQAQFRALMESDQPWNELALPDYEPWWCIDEKEERRQARPPLPTDTLPPLSQLMKTTPSPVLRYHAIHLLLTYAYLQRKTLGDMADDPAFLLKVLESMSVLFATTSAATLRTLDDAIDDVQQHLVTWGDDDAPRVILLLLKDADRLLTPPSASLSPAAQVPSNASANAEKEDTTDLDHAIGELYQLVDWLAKQSSTGAADRKKFKLATKKAFFFLVYGHSLTPQERHVMSLAVRARHQQLDRDLHVFAQEKDAAERAIEKDNEKKKIKIQEL